MEKDFDKWNEVKKKVDKKSIDVKLFPKEGEVWMCILGKNIGREQNGGGDNFSRAMLVVKKFNNEIFWAISLSTKQKELDYYFNFKDNNNNQVSAVLVQMRVVHIKRFVRKMHDFNATEFEQIKDKLRGYLL